jgi:PAS domain S-box-containing protein
MDVRLSAYIVSMLGMCLAVISLAGYAWLHRKISGAIPLVWLALSVAEWLLTSVFKLQVTNPAVILLWAKLQYVGIVDVPVAWFVFAAPYAGRGTWLTFRRLALLLLVPAITLLLVFTNDVHGLIWTSVSLSIDSIEPLEFTYGPWFWVHSAYSYTLMLLGSVLLLRASVRTGEFPSGQIIALLLSAIMPFVGNALYISRVVPIYLPDLTPLTFGISTLILGWSLFRFRLLDIVPVAHDRIIQEMGDGIIVADAQNRVVDINPAAAYLIDRNLAAIIGQPIQDILPNQPTLIETCRDDGEGLVEIRLDQQNEPRDYEVQISPLRDRRGQVTGRLLTLHDITERKRTAELQQFLAEASTLLASSLDYETTLATVARLAVPHFADWCIVHILEADASVRQVALTFADPSKQELALEIEHYTLNLSTSSSSSKPLRTRRSELVADVTDGQLVAMASDARHLEILRALRLCSIMSIPLIAHDRTLGILMFWMAESGRHYGQDTLVLAEDLAHRAALAVENAQLYLRAVVRAEVVGPIHNPYIFGNPVSGNLFVGREEVFRRLEELWGQEGTGPSLLLYGQRRMGKSSILQNLKNFFNLRTIIVDFDMQLVGRVQDTRELLFNLALKIYDSWCDRGYYNLEEPTKTEFLEYSPYISFDRFLNRLNHARDGQRFIIMVDEFEMIEHQINEGRIDPFLLHHWRATFMTYPWFIMVFAGLHQLEEMRHDYWNPLFGSVTAIQIGFISETATKRLIVQPIPEFSIEYDTEAVDFIFQLTHGQPYLVQMICHYLVTQANRQSSKDNEKREHRLTIGDVETVLKAPEFYSDSNAYCKGVWVQAQNSQPVGQLDILKSLNKEPLPLEAIVDKVGLSVEQVKPALEVLQERGVIEQCSGKYAYTVEIMRRWVVQRQE